MTLVRTSPGRPPKETVYLTGSNASARLAINLAVRVEGDPVAIAPRIRDAILGYEPNVAIVDISTLGEALESSLGYPRFLTLMLNVFGSTGLLLAAIGIYGLGSYTVAQRRQEIGVRMAVGADRAAIMSLVVTRGVWLAAVGTLLGTIAARATTKFLSALLFGLSATDPLTLVATALILLFTAACASYLPAHRASRIDLASLLRSE